MKRLITLLFILLSGFLFSQDKKPGSSQASNEQVSKVGTSYSSFKDYYPLSIYDPRFRVKKISFVRRHADTGRGEFLDVQMDLEGRVEENVDYAIYVYAANEVDTTNPDEREVIPYPRWRKIDTEKDTTRVRFSKITPENFGKKEIWGEELIKKKQEEVLQKNEQGYDAEVGEPTFDETIQYLIKNPAKALKFTIYGEMGPTADKAMIHNYTPPTEEEKKRQVHDTLPNHTYTVYGAKYATTILSHHYTQYRPNFVTFNKVAILIFDAKKEKNNLVYRAFLDIGDIKMKN